MSRVTFERSKSTSSPLLRERRRIPTMVGKTISVDGVSFLVVLCVLAWSKGLVEEKIELMYTGGIRSLYHYRGDPMNTVVDSIEVKFKSFTSKLNKFKSQTHDLRAKETHFKLTEESSLNDISSARKLTFQKFMDVDHFWISLGLVAQWGQGAFVTFQDSPVI